MYTSFYLLYYMSLLILSHAQQLEKLVGRPWIRDAYLTGSEFEDSLVASLLNSSAIKTVNDDLATLLSSSNFTYMIEDPDKPFEFIDRQYYWSLQSFEQDVSSDNITVWGSICTLNISADGGIFSQMFLPSGQPAEEIVFGCENNKECCGLKCCGDDVLINIIIVGVISLALLFLLICNILIGFKKRRENRKSNASVVYEVGRRTQDTIAGSDEIDANQITIHTRHPGSQLNTSQHPNHI